MGMSWEGLQTCLTLLSCAFYVLSTYGIEMHQRTDWAFTALFTLDFFLRIYVADNRYMVVRD